MCSCVSIPGLGAPRPHFTPNFCRSNFAKTKWKCQRWAELIWTHFLYFLANIHWSYTGRASINKWNYIILKQHFLFYWLQVCFMTPIAVSRWHIISSFLGVLSATILVPQYHPSERWRLCMWRHDKFMDRSPFLIRSVITLLGTEYICNFCIVITIMFPSSSSFMIQMMTLWNLLVQMANRCNYTAPPAGPRKQCGALP